MAASPNIVSHGPFAIFTKSQATAAKRTWLFYLTNSADGTAATGKTIATTDFMISKAGGALAEAAGVVTELTVGWYKMVWDVLDIGTEGPLGIQITEAGCDSIFTSVMVTVMDLYTATMNPGAAGITSASFAAGAIDAAALATDAIGVAEIAAAVTTEIQSGLATAAGVAALAVGQETRAYNLGNLESNASLSVGMLNAIDAVVQLSGTWDSSTITVYTSMDPAAGVGALWTEVVSGDNPFTADGVLTVTGPVAAVRATMSSFGASSDVNVTVLVRYATGA